MHPGTLNDSGMKLRGITSSIVLALALVSCKQEENAGSPQDSSASSAQNTPAQETPTEETPAPEPAPSATETEKESPVSPATPSPESPEGNATGDKPEGPRVTFETSEGSFVLELDPVNAPISTKNFLSYVNDGFYDGTIFHRVIDGFMIQGGGFELIDGKGSQKETKAPIKNAAKNGLQNKRGTISMARTSDPDSATSQFFINVVDNPGLDPKSPDNPQGFSPDGYAVFGMIVEGMETIDKIKQSETGVKRMMVKSPSGDLIENSMSDAPLRDAVIKKASVTQSQ